MLKQRNASIGHWTNSSKETLLGVQPIADSKVKGVRERRIDYGPGYRVYFGRDGEKLVILLTGGNKKSQSRDVRKALEYWKDYKERKGGKR